MIRLTRREYILVVRQCRCSTARWFFDFLDADSIVWVKKVLDVTSCEIRKLDWSSSSLNIDSTLDCCELWDVNWEKEADWERSKSISIDKSSMIEQILLC